MSYDPIKLAQEIGKVTVSGYCRKYYRTARSGKWYGGIATADCCGCNLKCVFCWSGKPRDHPEKIGKFYTPEHIFKKLNKIAKKFGYKQLRISGNEPTLGKEHLLKLLELIDQTDYIFILESNGILIGQYPNYAKQLSNFKGVHVRISIKGTNREEFARLTGAIPESFDLQLNALKNLLNAGVSCHPAVMLSFSSESSKEQLMQKLQDIDLSLIRNFEEEYVFLYPHVVKRLDTAKIKPNIAYSPNQLPRELI